MSGTPLPYGPNTPIIRQFLVRLAGLSRSDRLDIVATYARQQDTVEFQRAEALLATTMERSGRTEARDALSGPLFQLLRNSPASSGTVASPEDEATVEDLDPVAEPALAALLALVVQDLLPEDAFHQLTAACARVLPIDG